MYNNRPGLKKATFCYIKQQQSSQGRYQRADPESAAVLVSWTEANSTI